LKVIKLTDGICIVATTEETEALGISVEDFISGSERCRAFLSQIIIAARENGIHEFADSAEVEVQQTKMGILITLTDRTAEKSLFTARFDFKDVSSLCEFCNGTLKNYRDEILTAELYFHEKGYSLIVKFDHDKQSFMADEALKNNANTDSISITKTEEYASLISRSPLEKIFGLSQT
jgi:hypothetical protein